LFKAAIMGHGVAALLEPQKFAYLIEGKAEIL
jgi:hypothetical protein